MIARIFILVCALLGAFVFSQSVNFVADYSEVANVELQRTALVVQDFESVSAQRGLTQAQALAQYQATENTFLRERGERLAATIERHSKLREVAAALEEGGPLERILATAMHYDAGLADAVWQQFQITFPRTAWGLVLGFVGLVFGAFVGRLLLALVCALGRGTLRAARSRRGLPSAS